MQKQVKFREILNVLLAENDAFQRLAITDLLILSGFQVIACNNGLEARDELLKIENTFDLIILDLLIPEIGGLELLNIIKSIDKLKEIPVIIINGDGELDTVAACLKAGATDFLIKPIRFNIIQNLKELLNNQPKTRDVNLCFNKNIQNEMGYYTIVRKIDKGASSSVNLVRKSTDQELYTLKIVSTSFMDEQERENLEKGVNLLRVITGPTIIKYYESFSENESINIIMEYAEGGSLTEKISEYSRQGNQIPKDQILAWVAQLVIAIHFIHSKNILHRNINTQNIFLNKEQVVKLGNFQSAGEAEPHNNKQTFFGTPYYVSPEIIEGQPQGKKSDIWALGCVVYELAMLKRPFQHNTAQILFEMIQNQPYDMDPSLDQDLQQIIEKTLQKDPNNRPTIEDLAAIPCIQDKINEFYKDHQNQSDQS